jgi:hypothetical protein
MAPSFSDPDEDQAALDAFWDDTIYAQGRTPGRLYASKSFTQNRSTSRDFGQPGRFVCQVFDDNGEGAELTRSGDEWIVTDVAGTRYQVKVLVSREAGNVLDLYIQKVPAVDEFVKAKNVLHLRREDARRLVEFFQRLDLVDPAGAETKTRLDEETVSALLNDPAAAQAAYQANSSVMRDLIAADVTAKDVIATSGRQAALSEFRRLLTDTAYFHEKARGLAGPEAVWQEYFEANPWVLGLGLGSQLFTSWDDARLEQVVAGFSVQGPGKRVDALMRTSGVVRSMVFAEIKHHGTPLLKRSEYRPGIFSPSGELTGGVSQVQGTVHRATVSLGAALSGKDADGFDDPTDVTYLLRPRSFLIIGRLSEFVSETGGHHRDQITSFELYRRHLADPEVITFDELLARAEWIVETGDLA